MRGPGRLKSTRPAAGSLTDSVSATPISTWRRLSASAIRIGSSAAAGDADPNTQASAKTAAAIPRPARRR
jgi:hypothetical protein